MAGLKGSSANNKLAWKADIKKARAPDDSGIDALHQNKLLSDKMGSLQVQKKELLILRGLFTGDQENQELCEMQPHLQHV